MQHFANTPMHREMAKVAGYIHAHLVTFKRAIYVLFTADAPSPAVAPRTRKRLKEMTRANSSYSEMPFVLLASCRNHPSPRHQSAMGPNPLFEPQEPQKTLYITRQDSLKS